MTNEWIEKLQLMTKEELNQILENEHKYTPETIGFVQLLLNGGFEEKKIESTEYLGECDVDKNKVEESSNTNGKISVQISVIIVCALICLTTVITVLCLVNQNNKKIAIENATMWINELVEEIYSIDDCSGKEYLLAQDKLVEIKALIDENEIDGILLTKYNEASKYLYDLKSLDDIYNLNQKNYDRRTYVKELGKLIRELTDEKVKNKLSGQGDILVDLSENVKNVILGKAFYAAQQYFEKEYTNCVALCIGEFSPYTHILDDYTFIRSNYAHVISVNGIDKLMGSEDEDIEYRWITTAMLASIVKKIHSKGGYAIFVNYYTENESDVYPPTETVWWNVGVDVSAVLVGNEVKYNITRYVDGETLIETGLSVDEALNFSILNTQ